MRYNSNTKKAIEIASFWHKDQEGKIKYNDQRIPFISHSFSVGMILTDFTDDEDVIVAGILHDLLEDTDYPEENLEKDFNLNIKNLVDSVTDKTENKKEIPWKESKIARLNHFKDSSSDTLMIVSADKIHNMEIVIDTYPKRDLSRIDLGEIIWYYKSVLEIIEERLDNRIKERQREVFNKLEKLLKSLN